MTDAVRHYLRLSVPLLLAGLFLSGCQTMRGMLKPYVCDCASSSASQTCPTDSDPNAPDEPTSALARSQQQTQEAVARARTSAQPHRDAAPSTRTLERDKRPKVDPMKLVDPSVEQAQVDLDDQKRVEALEAAFGVSLPARGEGSVFSGNFAPSDGDELAVVRPDRGIAFYGTDGRISQMPLDVQWAPDAFEQIDVAPDHAAPRAVRVIQDGTLQLLLHWRERGEDGRVALKVGAFKAIGPFVGTIFKRTLATGEADGAELRRRGAYEFLHGEAARYIRWLPADDDGELLVDQAELLHWNRWEGVYRVPKPPPTAPKREELRSNYHPAHTEPLLIGALGLPN